MATPWRREMTSDFNNWKTSSLAFHKSRSPLIWWHHVLGKTNRNEHEICFQTHLLAHKVCSLQVGQSILEALFELTIFRSLVTRSLCEDKSVSQESLGQAIEGQLNLWLRWWRDRGRAKYHWSQSLQRYPVVSNVNGCWKLTTLVIWRTMVMPVWSLAWMWEFHLMRFMIDMRVRGWTIWWDVDNRVITFGSDVKHESHSLLMSYFALLIHHITSNSKRSEGDESIRKSIKG